MSDLKLSLNPDSKPDPNAAVTPIDRHELIRKLQTAALGATGSVGGQPRRAARRYAPARACDDRPAAPGHGSARTWVVRRETEAYLKVVREVERVARLDMELADGQDD